LSREVFRTPDVTLGLPADPLLKTRADVRLECRRNFRTIRPPPAEPADDQPTLSQREHCSALSRSSLVFRFPDVTPFVVGIHHVHAAMPPTLVFHGDADRTVPLYQAQIFVEKVRAVGAAERHKLVVQAARDTAGPR
jgi:acetyl esterase/lipase